MTTKMTLEDLQDEFETLAATMNAAAKKWEGFSPAKLRGDAAFALAAEDQAFLIKLEDLTENLRNLEVVAEELALSAELARKS